MLTTLRTGVLAALLACLGFPLAAQAAAGCVPLDGAKQAVLAARGSWVDLSQDQWQFIRGAYAFTIPVEMPSGDRAALGRLPSEDDSMVFFIDGDRTCERFKLSLLGLKMLLNVGEIKHGGDPT